MADEELFFSGVDLQNRGSLKGARAEKRSSTEASNATPSINSDVIDIHEITALAVSLTDFNVSGTPTRGQELIISIKDNGTARAITLGADFEAQDISLPTTTAINIKLVMTFLWNVTTLKWTLISMSKISSPKLDFISLTHDADLDKVFILKGDHTGGTFPAPAPAPSIGWAYRISANCTMGGIDFKTDDIIVALVDNPSTITYSANWLLIGYQRLELYKDKVLTFTGKRITKRAPAITQSATPTINTDVTDVAHITGLAQNIASFTTNLTGTPVQGDTLRIDITDNGTARIIVWGSSFESSGGATLPTTTVISTRLDIGFVWNSVTSKWRVVAVC